MRWPTRWPLQPLQPLQKTQLQPPFGPSVDSLCHPWFTTTNLSYRFPILKLLPPPCAALLADLFFMAMSPDIPLISMAFCGTLPLFYLLVLSRAWGNDPCSLATIIPFSHSSMFRVLNFPSRWSAVYLGTWYWWTAGAGAGHKSSIHIGKRWRITTWNSDYEMMHTVMLESIHLIFLIKCLD